MTPPPINPGNNVEWLINVEGNIVGPLKESELVAYGMKEDTLVYNKYLCGWEFARNIPVLSYLFTGIGTHDTSIGNYHPAIPTNFDSDEDIEDIDVGHPYLAPFIGLIGTVIFFLFMYAKLSKKSGSFEYQAADYLSRASSGHSMSSSAIMGILLILSPAIIYLIIAFVNVGYASHNAGLDNNTAQRRSGAATAWGIVSIIYVAALFFIYK